MNSQIIQVFRIMHFKGRNEVVQNLKIVELKQHWFLKIVNLTSMSPYLLSYSKTFISLKLL